MDGRVTIAIALVTTAPHAQRSEQACRVVSRPFSQGSLTSAGKPSTLCSSAGVPPRLAASSGWLLSPACDNAAFRGREASLAAQPRQAIGSIACMEACRMKPAMNERSIRCFSVQINANGPVRARPRCIQAAFFSVPINCRAWRCGAHRFRGLPLQIASRFWAKGTAERTAHTPEAGRGWNSITAQSPLAKR